MQKKCPDIRIPHLYGFGFSEPLSAKYCHFTHEGQRPFYVRLARMFQRYLHDLFGYPVLSHYSFNPTTHQLPAAYMILEHIGPDVGRELACTWTKQREDPARRQRLFRGMARLILSLARIPQSRIGSFRFNNDCTITLTNRPLICSMIILENDGTPRTINEKDTYMCTEAFVADMLSLHENRFLSNLNAVIDEYDCRTQMADQTFLRALSHNYIKRERRNGPFLLQLTDFHASNIFVDEDWNITCLIDLEWMCFLPAEMIDVPYWVTGCPIY
ncbi:Uncharacterized protein TCAP_04425 [Tolypocladium capitatum]|uniref:Uncharacterized protein n=1 Tax=Tolypocladium capitatum TaxID=45235 RepID=A0A2K3QDM9_9HYPO|nr:Uncharacterized protein TCAP_04425 [Tolypocladium capitatum]